MQEHLSIRKNHLRIECEAVFRILPNQYHIYFCPSSQSDNLNNNTLRIISISSNSINNILEVGSLLHEVAYPSLIPPNIVNIDAPVV